MAIVSSKSFELVNAKTRAAKGPLIRVEIEPGRFVKMYQADAEAQGLVQKSRPPAEDKGRKPQEDKGAGEQTPTQPPPKGEGAEADDFTTIPGVGKATARALTVAGITSFAELRTADLSRIVSSQVQEAIEAWRGEAA